MKMTPGKSCHVIGNVCNCSPVPVFRVPFPFYILHHVRDPLPSGLAHLCPWQRPVFRHRVHGLFYDLFHQWNTRDIPRGSINGFLCGPQGEPIRVFSQLVKQGNYEKLSPVPLKLPTFTRVISPKNHQDLFCRFCRHRLCTSFPVRHRLPVIVRYLSYGAARLPGVPCLSFPKSLQLLSNPS